MKDSEVIDAFVEFLRTLGDMNLQVDSRPDEHNRTSPDIDALAGPFAIEHTSVDTLDEQRRRSAWFVKVVGELEEEFAGKLEFRLQIAFEYDAITTGQDWDKINEALRSWISQKADSLHEGRSYLTDITGIPFPLTIHKDSNRPNGINFSRLVPRDNTLIERVREKLTAKATKLAPYHSIKTTILLVESDDIALMNRVKMLESVQAAFPNGLPAEVDQFWYVDTSIPEHLEFANLTPDLP